MQRSKFLESNTKFSFNNHRATSQFGEDKFAKWSNHNFYRTSTNDMSAKVSRHRRLLLENSFLTPKFVTLSAIESTTSRVGCHPRLRRLCPQGQGQQPVPRQAHHRAVSRRAQARVHRHPSQQLLNHRVSLAIRHPSLHRPKALSDLCEQTKCAMVMYFGYEFSINRSGCSASLPSFFCPSSRNRKVKKIYRLLMMI